MSLQFFLIDFENVQPKALDRLKPGACQIKVFLGEHQSRLMLDLVQALQPFGADAEYIQIQGNGPDAVDFHIAFYIGRLAQAHPGAAFNIISKDKGFDPLVKHLAKLGIGCLRLPEIPSGGVVATSPAAKVAATTKPKVAKQAAAKPKAARSVTVAAGPGTSGTPTKPATATTTKGRVAAVVARLGSMKASRPAKLATLRSSIKAWFKPALDEKAIDAVLQSLQGSKKIAIAGTKVTYMLG